MIGSHLLGRKPSPPDPRDYKMGDVVGDEYGSFINALMSLLRTLFDRFFGKDEPDPVEPPGPVQPGIDDPVRWTIVNQLDQEDTPHCVGFAGAHWESAEPVPFIVHNEEGHRLYYGCKVTDGETGEENGTWVRSLAQVLQTEGRIGPYYFADDTDGAKGLMEVRQWLREHGPVVFGTTWYYNMFDPDASGVVTAGDREVAGGHSFLCIGDEPANQELIFQNSWGSGWGDYGLFRMHYDLVKELIDDYGEAMGTTEFARA